MIGSIRWNLIAGLIGFAGTFLLSFTKNVLSTALTQSLYSGCILFVLCFVFRFLLGLLAKAAGLPVGDKASQQEAAEPSHLGQTIDLVTPASDADNPLELVKPDNSRDKTVEKSRSGDEFEPLAPPKFVSKLDALQMAEAVRKLTGE